MFRVKDAAGKPKYAGRSRAIVKDNRDPLQKGRIQVDHPILGNTVWINYLRDPGTFDVPSIGDVVYIEADSGEYEHPVAWGAVTIGPDASPELPAQFRRDTPTNRGFFTPGGHLIEMDDGKNVITQELRDDQFTTENRGIRITTKGGNNIHINEDTDSGNQSILIADAGGNFVKLDYHQNILTIRSAGKISTNAATDQTEIIGGNLTINIAGSANVTAGGNATVTAAEIHLNGTAGNVLTTQTDPIVDTIFGVPTTGVPTVKSG